MGSGANKVNADLWLVWMGLCRSPLLSSPLEPFLTHTSCAHAPRKLPHEFQSCGTWLLKTLALWNTGGATAFRGKKTQL